MNPITLAHSTEQAMANRILQGVIGVFEQAFPERIRGYYLRGSYGSGSTVPNSDLDLYVIFKQDFQDAAEVNKAVQLCSSCALISPVLLEIAPGGEVHLSRSEHAGLALNFKLSTQFLYGEDIRDKIPMPSSEAWRRWAAHAPIASLMVARPDQVPLIFPLDYPDLEAEFYGYCQQMLPCLDGTEHPSTKLLIATVGWLATGSVALQTGEYISSKQDAVRLHKIHINNEWSDFVEQVYEQCRNCWHYLIPAAETDRQLLRLLCQKALAFSNHFLIIYRDFLLCELHSQQTEHQLLAVKHLKRIVYPNDQEIASALGSLQQSQHEVLKQAASEAFVKMRQANKS